MSLKNLLIVKTFLSPVLTIKEIIEKKENRFKPIIAILLVQCIGVILCFGAALIAESHISEMSISAEQINDGMISQFLEMSIATVCLSPLFFLLITMYVHWIGIIVGGNGKMTSHFLLVLWCLIPSLMSLILGIIILGAPGNDSTTFMGYSIDGFTLGSIVYFSYTLIALKVVHNISWLRSTVAYFLALGIPILVKINM